MMRARRSTSCCARRGPARFPELNARAAESACAVHVIAGEREGIRRLAFPAREHLVDVHPLVLEAVRTAGEIDLPDAVALVPRGRDRPLAVLFQALGPLQAGAGVVAPQRLDVRDLESGAGHLAKHERQVGELAVRENVAVDEFPRPHPHPAAVGVARSDAVVHDEATLREQRSDLREISLEMAQADVLEHAYARDLVEDAFAGDIAVVFQADFAAVPEALLPDPLRNELVLVAAERNAGRAGAVFFRRAQDERAPAASDVEKPLAGAEHELVEDVVEFLLLGRVQGIGLAAEIGAGIHHVPIQPQRIEVVRDVVVVPDRVAVAPSRVTPDTAQAAAPAGSGGPREAFRYPEHLEYRPL